MVFILLKANTCLISSFFCQLLFFNGLPFQYWLGSKFSSMKKSGSRKADVPSLTPCLSPHIGLITEKSKQRCLLMDFKTFNGTAGSVLRGGEMKLIFFLCSKSFCFHRATVNTKNLSTWHVRYGCCAVSVISDFTFSVKYLFHVFSVLAER